MLNDRLRKTTDVPLLILTAIIALFGVMVLFSATRTDPSAAWKKQIIWLALGSAGMFAAANIDFHAYTRFERPIYVTNLLLLAAVLVFAHSINGAARWINLFGFKFQPSEFAKLLVIITLAIYLQANREKIHEFGTFIKSLMYVFLPMVLIFKQPDLGTALVILAIWVGMTFIAGAKIQHMVLLAAGMSVLFCGLWYSGKVIKPYQRKRIIAFLNPDADKSGSGWHVSQAKTAIGSGQFLGKGLFKGSMVHGGYIPEKQTDFIYTTVGEELGFVGSTGLVILYGVMLLRCLLIMACAEEDMLGKLIAAGIIAMFGFHILLNIGMNIGIMPVAGVPLPLVSAGGSNVLVTLYCIGLLQSIAVNRHQLVF